MLFGILMVLFLLVCIFLCLLVLIQSDKGGGIAGSIGGGLANANTLLGTQDTANILTRGTTIFAAVYMVLCIVLTLFFGKTSQNQTVQSELKKRAEVQSYSPSSVLQKSLPTEQPGSQTPNAPLPLTVPQNTKEQSQKSQQSQSSQVPVQADKQVNTPIKQAETQTKNEPIKSTNPAQLQKQNTQIEQKPQSQQPKQENQPKDSKNY